MSQKIIIFLIIILNFQSWSLAEDKIDKLFGVKLNTDVLDYTKIIMPENSHLKVLSESGLRAINMCQPLTIPTTGYDNWKELILVFNPKDMWVGKS